MTSRLSLAMGIVGLLVLAACESRFEEHDTTGIPAATDIGSSGGSGSTDAPEARAVDDTDEGAPAGVIETELGYPVQDERMEESTGF